MVNSDKMSVEVLPVIYKRPLFDYQDHCDIFRLEKRDYEQQFFPYYNVRLRQQLDSLKENAIRKWGEDVTVIRLSDMGGQTDESKKRIAVMGILFKHLDNQPSILKEVSEEHQNHNLGSNLTRFTSESDYLVLQDGSETIRLTGDLNVSDSVTGVVACVLGTEDEDSNSFIVEGVCYAGPSSNCPKRMISKDKPKFLLFVSGLGFSFNESEQLLDAREMLFDMLTGRIQGSSNEKASRIVKLIVAGNCIGKDVRKEAEEREKHEVKWTNKSKTYTAPIIRKIDQWLSELGKHIEIDVLPGEYDPSSFLLPQQPFHPALLPECSALQSIRCTTNPYAAEIDGTLLLGSSGQTVNTIRAYSEIDEAVQIMCRQLEWSHQAPIAPDCLHSYPFVDRDPFIINQLPHVYFVGNQPNFNTMMFDQNGNHTRLISLPDFESSYIGVLLNLNDLSVEICAFS